MKYNTRFNPTISGPLHIGHLYMALVNEAEAHHTGGKFIVRADDTQDYWNHWMKKDQQDKYYEEYQEQLGFFMNVDVWELQVITAVAIGGVSLFGYEGSFFGVFLGILAIQVIQNGLIIIGLSPYLNTIVVGIILLFTAFVDWRRRASLDILREQAG